MHFYYAFLVLMICQLQKCPLLLNNSLHVIKIVFFAGQFNHKMLFSSDLFVVFSLESNKDLFQDLFWVRLITSKLYPRLTSPFYYYLDHQLVGQKNVNILIKPAYFWGKISILKYIFPFLQNCLFVDFHSLCWFYYIVFDIATHVDGINSMLSFYLFNPTHNYYT